MPPRYPLAATAADDRLGTERHPHGRAIADLDAEEGGLGDADDLEWMTVERNRGANCGRRSEVAAPERMRDDGDGRAAGTIVGGREQPACRGADAERGKTLR